MIHVRNNAPSKQRTLLLDRLEQRTLFSAAAFFEPAMADVDLGSVVDPLAVEQSQDYKQANTQPNPVAALESVSEFSYHDPAADAPSYGDLLQPTHSNELTPEAAPGDFNRDGIVDAVDIDMLRYAMSNRLSNDVFDATFDLNEDGKISHGDVEVLVQDIIGTDFGDANLDGRIDEIDAKILLSSMFSAASGWSSGEFTGDGIVDGQDFIVWNSNKLDLTPSAASPAATEDAGNIVGDFNGDGAVDDLDIDLLCSAMQKKAMQTNIAITDGDSEFDLNRDGLVSRADLEMLVRDVIGTEFGDTNLDGRVDGLDAAMILKNMFTATSGWSSGDVSCDGVVDGQDFIVWNANKTTTPQLETAAEVAEDADASVSKRQLRLDASESDPNITRRVAPAFSYWNRIHNANDRQADLWGKTGQDAAPIRRSETHADEDKDTIYHVARTP
jgi:hypothetical protein